MISDLVRKWAKGVVMPLARLIGRTGIPPNTLTVMGFALNGVAAYVLAVGHERVGGLLVLLAGAFDAIDGALARTTGSVSPFGAFLDSTLDRFSEAALCFGLLVLYVQRGAWKEVLLIYATIVGSLMVSYARARAEGLGIECKVGLFTRFERVVVLALGLIFRQPLIALWILAIGSNLTALQRMYHVWRVTRDDG